MLPNDDPFEFLTGQKLLEEDRGPAFTAAVGCLCFLAAFFTAIGTLLAAVLYSLSAS